MKRISKEKENERKMREINKRYRSGEITELESIELKLKLLDSIMNTPIKEKKEKEKRKEEEETSFIPSFESC